MNTTASAAIGDLSRIKARTRSDRRACSIPLLTFGTIALTQALIGGAPELRGVYWVIAGPTAFGTTAWFLRRREVDTGAGTRWATYRSGAILMAAAFVLLPLLLVGAPLALVGVGLLAVAVRQRITYLAAAAAAFAVAGVLAEIGLLQNRIYDLNQFLGTYEQTSGYTSSASTIAQSLPGAVLLAAGLWARRKEGRRAS